MLNYIYIWNVHCALYLLLRNHSNYLVWFRWAWLGIIIPILSGLWDAGSLLVIFISFWFVLSLWLFSINEFDLGLVIVDVVVVLCLISLSFVLIPPQFLCCRWLIGAPGDALLVKKFIGTLFIFRTWFIIFITWHI